jgi:membrane protein YqaA with SNARE-associated domain
MGLNAIALAWGAAEATLFFIVPDVLLSATAVVRGRRRALIAIVWVVVGAVAGGVLMYAWGRGDSKGVQSALDLVPAISLDMIGQARAAFDRRHVWAMLDGAFSGVPYKVYAATASSAGIGAPTFLIASIPARAARFIVVVLVAAWIDVRLRSRLDQRQRLTVLALVWIVFYATYFSIVPG